MLYWDHINIGKSKQSLLDFPSSDSLTEDSDRGNCRSRRRGEKYQEADEKKNQIKGRNLQKPKLLE